jgi:molecular chaperone GrpE
VSKQDPTPVDDIEKEAQPEATGAEPEEPAEDTLSEPTTETGESVAEVEEAPSEATVKPDQALAEAQKQARDYFEGWQRERADFSNYKKRAERDLMTMRFNAKVDTLKSLVPMLDDFERAMDNLPEELAEQPWLDGISAIQRKFNKILEDEGIQTIDPVGELFDPTIHEAIGQDADTDIESGHITATLQKGYICGDRVLRPALVRVAQ